MARNVLRWGTGALNIDRSRISLKGEKAQEEYVEQTNNLGRWPTNLILQHKPECHRVGVKSYRTPRNYISSTTTSSQMLGWKGSKEGEVSIHYGDKDGTETVEAWDCAPGCSVQELDEQSGIRPATMTGRADPFVSHDHPSGEGYIGPERKGMGYVFDSSFTEGKSRVYADVGGASRYFKHVKDKESSDA